MTALTKADMHRPTASDPNPNRRRPRVLFPLSTPLSFAVAAPVIRRLHEDGRFDLWVTSRHVGRAESDRLLSVPTRRVARLLAPWRRFDAAVCPGYYFRGGRVGLRIEMFHGVSMKNYAVRKDLDGFDRCFLIGEYHRRKMVQRGLLRDDDPRALCIGMPKTDPLARSPERDSSTLERLGLDPTLPSVLYAPTRSGEAGSSLEHGGIEAMERAAQMPINLMVKLHDRSQRRYRRKLNVDYDARFTALAERAPRVRLVHDHDVVPLMRAADVLVSDLSSAANEFLLLDRPLVYLSVPRHEERVRQQHQAHFPGDPIDLDWIRRAGVVVERPEDLPSALARGFADPGEHGALRRERASMFFYNPGRATEEAVGAMGRLLLDGANEEHERGEAPA